MKFVKLLKHLKIKKSNYEKILKLFMGDKLILKLGFETIPKRLQVIF